ncbi:MAG TPA: efflux RND transporter periplasmic adaptor subunit [Chitinophagaceae bacterium]|jgi:HlyD family secretion protein
MKKRIIWILIVLIVAAAVVVWIVKRRATELVLSTEKPHYGYIANAVTSTGTIQPVDTVAVGTQESGTISHVYADFNSKVKKGQLLAELDKTILNAQVQQIIGSLQQVQSQESYAQSNFNRQTQLYNAGAISKADLETAENTYKVAQANVKSTQSQLDAAQKNLSLASIYSPIDGTILSRNVSEGQTVAASFNTPTLFSIAKDLTQMQVRAAVDEADIGNVQYGQRVTFTVDAFPDDVFDGTLQEVRLQPVVSSNVVTYTTIINAPNQQLKLKPGMTANISIYTKEDSNALVISARATKFKPDSTVTSKYQVEDKQTKTKSQQTSNDPSSTDKPKKMGHKNKADSLGKDSGNLKRASVWVLNGNTISRRSIKIGLEDGTQVQVLSGLTTNDQVIDGVQQMAKGNQTSTQRSPFMPQRRGGQGNTRPSGGGRGG